MLFGAPSANTGLGDDACRPACGCGFEPPAYTADDVAAWRARTLQDPPVVLPGDPYADPALVPDGAGVCAVIGLDAGAYRLETFPDREAAIAAGASPTHDGACGSCSSLQDLATYVAEPDLTGPVRECGLQGAFSGEEAHLACLEALGFTPACARIWRYNTLNTQASCLESCLALLDAPYHEPDGALNDCIQCDEDLSGPVFKAVAGRTRRNSGLPSALCRPCDTVWPVVHAY